MYVTMCLCFLHSWAQFSQPVPTDNPWHCSDECLLFSTLWPLPIHLLCPPPGRALSHLSWAQELARGCQWSQRPNTFAFWQSFTSKQKTTAEPYGHEGRPVYTYVALYQLVVRHNRRTGGRTAWLLNSPNLTVSLLGFIFFNGTPMAVQGPVWGIQASQPGLVLSHTSYHWAYCNSVTIPCSLQLPSLCPSWSHCTGCTSYSCSPITWLILNHFSALSWLTPPPGSLPYISKLSEVLPVSSQIT